MQVRQTLTGMLMVAVIAGCGVDADPERGAETGAEPAAAGDAVEAPMPAPAERSAAPDRRALESATEVIPSAEIAAAPELQDLEQPAIWPAADVVFATPEEAAADFVREVLISDGDPALGAFQQGDSRSGEIAVQFAGEDGTLDPPMEKGILALRQLGPDDGWFVIAATSDGATITSPAALAEVAAGAVTVEGEARGFESTVVVRAFPPGDIGNLLDQAITSGGAFSDVEPYSTTLDLSGAAAGDVVVILVQGDTGLGSDPSTFAALPVTIADDAAPATIPPTIPPTR